MDKGNYIGVKEDRIQLAISRHSAKLSATGIYSHTVSHVCTLCMNRYMCVCIYTHIYVCINICMHT